MTNLKDLYSQSFYDDQVSGSYQSAKIYVDYLKKFYSPKSVADVGCGRGTWLKAFKESGAEKLYGFDGAWNSQQNMLDNSIIFSACDLNQPIQFTNQRVDLSVSLEVAEHLNTVSSKTFVESLTKLADVVLFGAAFIGQGGINHINNQRHSFWANHFAAFGYVAFDVFRPALWGDEEVEYFYRQNAFLYVRKDSDAFKKITSKGAMPISHLDFMDCVHPELFSSVVNHKPNFKESLKILYKSLM